jgi:hypothetical protein
MSSSTTDANNEENISYKPGTFRYQDVPIHKRKQLFEARQRELNPCLKVRNLTVRLVKSSFNRYRLEQSRRKKLFKHSLI